MSHLCHAVKCNVHVSPALFMCKKHWALVPPQLKADILRHYRKGQEVDKRPSIAYLRAVQSAIRAVADVERGMKEIPLATVQGVIGGDFVPSSCELCGKVAELRPYGPNGENICFACGMKREEVTKKRFNQVVLGEDFDA